MNETKPSYSKTIIFDQASDVWKGCNWRSQEGKKVLNILWTGLSKKSEQLPLTKANILKHQNWIEKYMKIIFPKVIFPNESGLTFDGLAKRWVLLNSDVPVAKRRQQVGGSVMIWAQIVDQTIIRPFKVNEAVKINSPNDYVPVS